MKEYLNKINNNEMLNSEDIDKLISDYSGYLNINLDNLSGVESLIFHQNTLIDIEQYLIFNHKYTNSIIQHLILSYDAKIKKQFKQFSKFERIKIAKKLGISELYEYVNTLEDYYTIEEINYDLKQDLNKLSTELRLLNNMSLINFDGFNAYAYEEPKKQKKKTMN